MQLIWPTIWQHLYLIITIQGQFTTIITNHIIITVHHSHEQQQRPDTLVTSVIVTQITIIQICHLCIIQLITHHIIIISIEKIIEIENKQTA